MSSPPRGEAALTTTPSTGEGLESDRLKANLGTALIERDLLYDKIAFLEARRPLVRRRSRRWASSPVNGRARMGWPWSVASGGSRGLASTATSPPITAARW